MKLKLKHLLLVSSLLTSVASFSQAGQIFPMLEGENLEREPILLPDDLAGKYTILGLAFSKKSEKALNTWFQPSYNQFLYKPEGGSLFAGNYDVKLYFIPMFTGVKRPAYEKVMKKMTDGLDPKLHPHVLFYQGHMKDYKKVLNFDGNDIPYFYVLDPFGQIIYTTSGFYSDAKMQEIVDAVEPAWGN